MGLVLESETLPPKVVETKKNKQCSETCVISFYKKTSLHTQTECYVRNIQKCVALVGPIRLGNIRKLALARFPSCTNIHGSDEYKKTGRGCGSYPTQLITGFLNHIINTFYVYHVDMVL